MIKQLTDKLITEAYLKKETTGTAGQMIVLEGMELVDGLRSSFKTFSPYVGQDLLAVQMMEYNLLHFAQTKTEKRLATMMELLVDENNQIRSFDDFKKLCEKKMEPFNTRYLEAEYNLSVAVGQSSAQYLRFMAEKDTVTSFVQYKTIGDKSVRESHRVLHNKIFNLSDKEAMDLFPPNGYGCRCEMVQYLGNTDGKVTKGTAAKTALQGADPRYKNSQFEINRGDLKQVFTKKQFYTDGLNLPERLNEMNFETLGLKKWEAFKKDLNPIQLDKTINEHNAKELFKPFEKNNYMGFNDYYGRKMILKKEVFDEHTQGKYLSERELRHQLFPHIEEILKKPDEVWYFDYKNNGQKFQSRYVKFYGDRTVIIDCDLDTETHALEIKTWYNMIETQEKSRRKGLKIK